MKKFRTLAALLVTALLTTTLAACSGGSGGKKAGEEFMLGEYKLQYEFAQIESGETTVSVLLKDRTGLPVRINNGSVSILISMKLVDGDEEVRMSKLSVDSLEQELRDFEGSRIIYIFETPEDREYPTARIYLTNDESQSVDLDIKSGLSVMGGGTSTGSRTTGLIIAIVVAALGIAGGVFASKKGFFKKDPGTGAAGMPSAMGEPVTQPAAPGAAPAAMPEAAPAATPVTPAAAPAVPAAPVIRLDLDDAPESVTFVENVRGDDGVSTYEVYKGPDKASAIAFLKTKTVDKENYFIVVDTPEGNFGRDIQGLYQE